MLEFTTGRFYSPDADQVIRAVEADLPNKDGDGTNPCIIFTDTVRQIAGVILWGQLNETAILSDYDQGYYRCATTAEVALVRS